MRTFADNTAPAWRGFGPPCPPVRAGIIVPRIIHCVP